MDTRLRGICLMGSLMLALTACDTAEDYDIELEDDLSLRDLSGGGTIVPPGYIGNGLEQPNVSGIDPAHGLRTSEGMAPSSELLDDALRHKTAKYLVECALPAGTSITKVVDGQTLVFNGHLGLAPEWEDGACDEYCQESVSACLLARTNVSGDTVMVHLTGHPALGYEHPEGTVLEATFWGNLFDATGGMYLCKGSALAVVEATREGRTCSQGSGQWCDFTVYSSCTQHARCDLAGPGLDVPTDCKGGALASGPAYSSISTFLAVQ